MEPERLSINRKVVTNLEACLDADQLNTTSWLPPPNLIRKRFHSRADQNTRGSPSRKKHTRSSNPAAPAHSISREGGSQAGS